METYDPLHAPDPTEWLALDESERIHLVLQYHRRIRAKLPNATLHAAFHAVVETQVAMGDELPVARTLERLQGEGLDRHEAVHAIGSVLAGQMHDLMRRGSAVGEPNELYRAALGALTADGWRHTHSPAH